MTMQPLTEERIRQRAYFLWEADGHPDGRDEHYWYLASSQLIVESVVPASQLVAADTPASKQKTTTSDSDGGYAGEEADSKAPLRKPKNSAAAPQGRSATKAASAKTKAPGKSARDGVVSSTRSKGR